MRTRDLLIVGSGGREHALAWKLRQSPDVRRLFVAPGNAGTDELAENVPIAAGDLPGIARFVQENNIDLTVVGPEAPLALGLADLLRAHGRRVVGPGAAAARLEASKAFAKDVMSRAGVPTAAYAVFDAVDAALAYLDAVPYPVVVKADGLAAGKGVVICRDRAEARATVRGMMVESRHGSAGCRVVIEEALRGPEVSLLALVDGERAGALPVAQDHKRLGEGDTGPNTGGMGAYAPVPFIDRDEHDRLMRVAIDPIVTALADAGTPYRGVLFAGLMLTPDGPRVLEYNCRFGDPEAQAIIPLIDGDLLPWLDAVADGALRGRIPTRDAAAVGVVLAAAGYPDTPRTGDRIDGLDALPAHVLAFHAGTARDAAHQVVTSGGRVLTVVGTGSTIDEAADRAYAAPVRFAGMQRRRDIGRQGRSVPTVREQATIAPARPGSRPRGMEDRARIAVLASGDGSNLQALLDACAGDVVHADVVLVVSHNPEARALERARAAGVATHVVFSAQGCDPEHRRRMEEQVLDLMRAYSPDLLVLAGWMLILSDTFLARCNCPSLNVHPALLPLHGGHDSALDPTRESLPTGSRLPVLRGAHAVRDAIALGLPYTGVSVHSVTADVDAGPVIAREVVTIEETDDEASLYRRIKSVEHRLLVHAVQTVLFPVLAGGVYA